MSLSHAFSFLRQYAAAPRVTGAVLPSSQELAKALAEPFARRRQPAHVLEVGAGTGPVTRAIGALLGPLDRFDVCEVQPKLARILDHEVLRSGPLGCAHQQGRVRLIRGRVEDLDDADKYDFIISGLPFTSFTLGQVQAVVATIRKILKPGGTFSYFEYLALRTIACTIALSKERRRARDVSRYLDQLIARHEVARSVVWQNVPPAYTRHWVFTETGID